MRKCKCNSNYCSRKNSVENFDDFLNTKNGITINNDNRSPDISKMERSRSVSPDYLKSKKGFRERSASSSSRSRSVSPTRTRKYSKGACKHIMFKTTKALCNPKLRKKYAKKIVKKNKKRNGKK